MIRQIRGTVLTTDMVRAVVEVQGLGLAVYMANPIALPPGEPATLYTHLAIKKDGIELYGFQESADRDFFELVLSVSGIGPKTALNILRRASREALEGAISARDSAYLTKVVGLGKKSVEKIFVELADKVGARAHSDEDGEVFDTLIALGYTEREARKAVQGLSADVRGKEARLRAALSASQ